MAHNGTVALLPYSKMVLVLISRWRGPGPLFPPGAPVFSQSKNMLSVLDWPWQRIGHPFCLHIHSAFISALTARETVPTMTPRKIICGKYDNKTTWKRSCCSHRLSRETQDQLKPHIAYYSVCTMWPLSLLKLCSRLLSTLVPSELCAWKLSHLFLILILTLCCSILGFYPGL